MFNINAIAVIRGIKNSFSVTSLNFTGCGLSSRGCEVLADIVRVGVHYNTIDVSQPLTYAILSSSM